MPDEGTTPNNEARIGLGDMMVRLSPLSQLPEGAMDALKDALNAVGTCICTASPKYKFCGAAKTAFMMPGGGEISTTPKDMEQQEISSDLGPTMTDSDISDITYPPMCCELVDSKVTWNGLLHLKFFYKVEIIGPPTVSLSMEFEITITPSIASEIQFPFCNPPLICRCNTLWITPQIKIEGGAKVTASIAYTIPGTPFSFGANQTSSLDLTGNVVFDSVKITCPDLPGEDDGKPDDTPK